MQAILRDMAGGMGVTAIMEGTKANQASLPVAAE